MSAANRRCALRAAAEFITTRPDMKYSEDGVLRVAAKFEAWLEGGPTPDLPELPSWWSTLSPSKPVKATLLRDDPTGWSR